MHRLSSLPSLVWAVMLVGCASESRAGARTSPEGQTYAQALTLICNVDELAGVDGSDPIAAQTRRAEYIEAKVENPDAIYFRTVLSVKSAEEQASVLAAEAGAHEVAPCPLVAALAGE